MKIFLVYGGKSAEHDISILTAHAISKAVYYQYYEVAPVYITKAGEWLLGPTLKGPMPSQENMRLKKGEVAVLAESATEQSVGKMIHSDDLQAEDAVIFPVLHGPNGEDGTVQGYFEVLNMPYVGAGVVASACGMDKIISKFLFQQASVPQVPYVPVSKRDWRDSKELVFTKCEGNLLYPMFVKPANMGSSVGISQANNREELLAAIEKAFDFDRRVVVEQGIEAREIEMAVLGNEDIHVSVPGEIVKSVGFYDYEEKYINNDVQLQIPADIPEEIVEKMQEYARRAYTMLDGSGLSRCDFFLTAKNEIYLNEINTMPGFTQYSMYPLLWENTGLNYGDLIEELIQLAMKRYQEKQIFQKNF